ncbi:DUF6266 family protein [Pedobacter nyackensis]|uniref:Uncharacterized protein n=1 Tax=Pedobacter nyackensis TaxID=475255 RepID=A0A1W2F0T8_9SPHI|nr:DUF6266 family protein [Pedobacter nyackensis]SMD15078.1 hypothetical protein SAMN04488101_11811 [Pedobacter nyackensis]
MGKLSRGFLGGFQGQLGTAYGCFWRLMDLIKAMPRKVKRAATEAQVPARLKMKLMTSFLARLKKIINIGFKHAAAPGQAAMNAAVSYNLSNAITGISPDFTIDFTKLLLSKGSLPLPRMITATAEAAAKVKFIWEENYAGSEDGSADDTASFIVYNETRSQFIVLTGVITRSALQYTLQLPPPFVGDTVHCYISFVGINGKEVSNSLYLGELVVV